MILFLDFDGVLHSAETTDKAAAFCHRPVFEAFLREYPHVEVVFSTSWRLLKGLNTLRAYFSEDVRHRFIGVTPDFTEEGELRSTEILAWMSFHWQTHPDRRFLALDDDPNQFPRECGWLVLCDRLHGLGEPQILDELRRRLK